jgi:hypothetical protein
VVSKAFLFTEILIKSNPFDVQAQTYSSFWWCASNAAIFFMENLQILAAFCNVIDCTILSSWFCT